MGPPIDHGAFLVPARPEPRSEKRAFNLFSRSGTNRFEELNNYSGQLTSRNWDDFDAARRPSGADGGHGRQRRLAPPPGTGAAQNERRHDQDDAEPDGLAGECERQE